MPYTYVCQWCGKTVTKRRKIISGCVRRFCDRKCSADWQWSQPDYAKSKRIVTLKRDAASRANMQAMWNKPGFRESVQKRAKALLSDSVTGPEIRRLSVEKIRSTIGFKHLYGNSVRITKHARIIHERLCAELPDGLWQFELSIPTRFGQRPFWYGVDVASVKYMIAIEVDGSTHCRKDIKRIDAEKRKFLEDRGWSVLHFWNTEIDKDQDTVIRQILEKAKS